MIDFVDRILKNAPVISLLYRNNKARIKREACLMLHKAGLLKPFAFVQWLSTYGCNFSCAYCEASAGTPGKNELTTLEALDMVDDLARMKVKRLAVSGGEPLVRKDILQVMGHAHRSGLKLGLISNGYHVETLWSDLRTYCYFLYFTSIDGLPKYNDKIRKKESFSRAMRSLELFSSIDVPSRIINSVVHQENIDQLDELSKIVKDSGATRWHLVPIMNVGRAENNSGFALTGSQLRWLTQFIRSHTSQDVVVDFGEACTYIGCFDANPVGNAFFCGAGLTRCAVMPDGEVLGCQTVYDNRFSEGNIREKKFSKIWKDKFSRFRQKKTFDKQCTDCAYFNTCQGGCWAEMVLKHKCFKPVWEKRCNGLIS